MFVAYCLNKETCVVTLCQHFSTDHHGDLQRMWRQMGTVTKSAPELCLTMVTTCPVLLLLRCCCCAVVADVLVFLLLRCAAVELLCVRVNFSYAHMCSHM